MIIKPSKSFPAVFTMRKFLCFMILCFLVNLQSNAQLCFDGQEPGITLFHPYQNSNNVAIRKTVIYDFNNDGYKDIAVLCVQPGPWVCIYNGNSSGAYTLANTYTVGSSPWDIALKDINGDTFADLLVSNSNSSNISVLLGTASGVFSAPANFSTGAGSIPTFIAVFDGNNDGYLDLAITNGGLATSISIMNGNGSGGFSFTYSITTASNNPSSIVSGDFNTDGYADLAWAETGITKINISLGNGTGNYAVTSTYSIPSGSVQIICKDIDADSFPDLLVANTNTATAFSVLKNQQNGAFAAAINYPVMSGYSISSMSVNDYNNDGFVDIVVVGTGPSNYTSLIAYYQGTSAGNFLSAQYSFLPLSVISNLITSADMNNDGNTDLAVTDATYNNIAICKGFGNGLFGTSNTYFCNGTSTTTGKTTYYDIDGDTIKDIIYLLPNAFGFLKGHGDATFEQFDTLINSATTWWNMDLADFNNDGLLDVVIGNAGNSIFTYLNLGNLNFSTPTAFSPCTAPIGLETGDINSDGNIDIVSVSDQSDNRIFIYYGNGAGGFSAPAILTTSLNTTKGVALKDLNHDGILDIICGVNVSLNGQVAVFIGTGSGNFTSASYFAVNAGYPTSVLVDDFNNDGNPDIATLNSAYNANNMSILMGNGSGSFTLSSIISNISLAYAKDMDIDGTLDLVVSRGSSIFTILKGSGTGSFTTMYTLQSVNLHGASVELLGDFNYDGSTDVCVTDGELTIFKNVTEKISYVTPANICGGSNKILTASPADTYQWYVNNAPIAGQTSATYNASASGIYKVKTTTVSGAMCSSDSVSLLVYPTLTVTGTPSVCASSSASLSVVGANTYSWTTGANTASISVSPVVSTTYTVTGTDLNNCTNTQTVSVTVNNTCADVWPGDANSDGTADNTDILELGLHYTQTGPVRASVSNSWQSYHANNWTGTITNGQNLNHSDCNGDGAINANDTVAIYNNYGLVHAFKAANTNTVNPQLSIVPDQNMVNTGQWGTASIYLGSSSAPISNINGIAFTINFDHTLIEPNSIYLDYPTSFVDAGQNLHFRKTDFNNDLIYTATTHTLSANASGYGKIAILHYRIKTTLTQDAVLNIGLSSANQSNASGSITPLTAGTNTLMAIGSTVGIDEISQSNTVVYPNPATNAINIISSLELQKVELTDVMGSLVLREQLSGKEGQLQVSGLANGIYFINVYGNNRIIRHEKIVVQR